METRDKDVKASAELERVRSAFKKFRDAGNGRGSGYPLDLRRLAVAAVNCGHSLTEVATATQVSGPSLGNWRRSSICLPTELKVIDDCPEPSSAREHAVIRFQSGLRIEIPVAALTPDFITRLNGVVP
jgi:hypothetical protein